MYVSPQINSRSAHSYGGVIARPDTGQVSRSVQPAFTSGFGSLMEQEHDLQSSTERDLGADHGPHSTALDRILRHHQVRLGANIALLEQRYEMLPHPKRFQALRGRHRPLTKNRRAATATESVGFMEKLVAQHQSVIEKIGALIAPRPEGQRGVLILTEMVHNHKEMAWMLTALIKEDESVRDRVPIPVIAAAAVASAPGPAEKNWENEGGALRSPAAPVPPEPGLKGIT